MRAKSSPSSTLTSKSIICVILSALILTLLAPGFGAVVVLVIMGRSNIFKEDNWTVIGEFLHPQSVLIYLSVPASFAIVLGATIVFGLIIVRLPKPCWVLAIPAGALTGMVGATLAESMLALFGIAAGAILGGIFPLLYGLLMRLRLPRALQS